MAKPATQPKAEEPLPNEDDVLRRLMAMPPAPRKAKAKKPARKAAR